MWDHRFVHLFLFSLVSETLFKPNGPDKALSGHVISSVTVTDVKECMKLCLVTVKCKSFNFSDQKKTCEMSGSKAAKSSLQDREGFYYYESSSYQVLKEM